MKAPGRLSKLRLALLLILLLIPWPAAAQPLKLSGVRSQITQAWQMFLQVWKGEIPRTKPPASGGSRIEREGNPWDSLRFPITGSCVDPMGLNC